MKERLDSGSDLALSSRCYHELFLGEDTDHAEAAAMQLAEFIAMARAYLSPKKS